MESPIKALDVQVRRREALRGYDRFLSVGCHFGLIVITKRPTTQDKRAANYWGVAIRFCLASSLRHSSGPLFGTRINPGVCCRSCPPKPGIGIGLGHAAFPVSNLWDGCALLYSSVRR